MCAGMDWRSKPDPYLLYTVCGSMKEFSQIEAEFHVQKTRIS